MQNTDGFKKFVKVSRANITPSGGKHARILYASEIIREVAPDKIEHYVAEKAPFFYRNISDIKDSFGEGYYLTAIKESLAKLPTSTSFQQSHFGEIIAGIFAEEVLGLKKLYSKLSLLTTENANAYKMDLVMYDPSKNPVHFVFIEVKSSPKNKDGGYPCGHDKSCYPSLFDSFNKYTATDCQFDLTAVKDNLKNLSESEAEIKRIREALKPYKHKTVHYAGITVIDNTSHRDDEAAVLYTRKNKKEFDVDLLCVENFSEVALETYKKLDDLKKICSS